MPTIIDSLIVKLGLDATNFKKGEQEATKSQKDFVEKSKRSGKELSVLDSKAAAQREKYAKEAQAQAKKAIESFSAMRNQALSLLSVFVGGMGLVEFAKSSIVTTAALGRLSDSVGVGIDRLGGWKVAAKDVGSSAEEMMADIDKASQTLALKRSKGIINESLKTYLTWGGGTQHGELKDTESYLFAMSDLIHKYNKIDPAKAKLISRGLGIGDNDFNLLKQGSEELRKQLDLTTKIAGLTKQQGDEAKKAETAWTNLGEAIEKAYRKAVFSAPAADIADSGTYAVEKKGNYFIPLLMLKDALTYFFSSVRQFSSDG